MENGEWRMENGECNFTFLGFNSNLQFSILNSQFSIKPLLQLFVILVLTISACEKSEPVDDNLVNAYVELRIAEAEYGEADDGRAVRFQILQKYGFSADSLERDIEKIKEEPAKWLEFQKSVTSILDSLEL